VPSLTLAALVDSRPSSPFWGRSWLTNIFERHLCGYKPNRPDDPRLLGWSVGAVMGLESLVQSRPILRGRDVEPLDDLLRTPSSCSVAIFSSGLESDAIPRDVVRTARFRRWVAVEAETGLDEHQRNALRSDLPDFLARDPSARTDGEILLLRFLAGLHRRGAFGKALPDPSDIRSSLRELRDEVVGRTERPFNFFISDGRTLGIVHEGGTLMAFEPPPDRPTEFRVDPMRTRAARSGFYLWQSGPPPEVPAAGAERIAPGVLSVSAGTPTQLLRD